MERAKQAFAIIIISLNIVSRNTVMSLWLFSLKKGMLKS